MQEKNFIIPSGGSFVAGLLFFFVWFRAADYAGYSTAFGRTLI